MLPCCVNGLSEKHTARVLLMGIWKNNIRIPSPVYTGLLCWPVPWSHAERNAALLSVQELVFQAADRSGKPLRPSIMFPYSPSCLLPYLQLHWQSRSCVSSLIHFQQSPTSLVREVRLQEGTFFQIQLKRFWPSHVYLPSKPGEHPTAPLLE